MGLDMYLRATEYVSRYDYDGNNADDNNPLFNELVEKFDVSDAIGDTPFGGISIDFPMGYWRKVNSVHNWFVEICGGGVDECQPMYVNTQHLEELKSLCEQVLADHSLAEELLPTSAGFFFGSTDFDEYYFKDLEYTVKVIDRCLKSKFDYFEYQASW
jgi:hypothetical protein